MAKAKNCQMLAARGGPAMKIRLLLGAFSVLFSFSVLARAESSHCPEGSGTLTLGEGWAPQSPAKVTAAGETISTPGFQLVGWYPAEVPTTVLAALVKDKVYPDPDFGMNLRKIPGADYSRPVVNGAVAPTNLSDLPLEPGSPFSVPWWYCKSFSLPQRLSWEDNLAEFSRD